MTSISCNPIDGFAADISAPQRSLKRRLGDNMHSHLAAGAKRLRLDSVRTHQCQNPSIPGVWTTRDAFVDIGGKGTSIIYAGRLARRRDELLGDLCDQVGGLSPEGRRNVLQQCFTESQRLALEQWMLKRDMHGRSGFARAAAVGNAAKIRRPHLSTACSSVRLSSTGAPARDSQKCAVPRLEHKLDLAQRCWNSSILEQHHERDGCDGSQVRGLVCQVSLATGSCSFYALACIGMARLTSRKCRDRCVALKHRTALAAICSHAVARVGPFEERLNNAIAEVLPALNLNPEKLGLRLSVRLSVCRWVGAPLASPLFKASDAAGLERGLQAWRRLHDAREALFAIAATAARESLCRGPPTLEERMAWFRLRDAFLDIEVEAGLDRTARTARLLQAERVRAAHRDALTERWNQKRMACEEHAQRQAAAVKQDISRRSTVGATRVAARVVRLLSKLTSVEDRLQRTAVAVAMTVTCAGRCGGSRASWQHPKNQTSKRCNHLRRGCLRL